MTGRRRTGFTGGAQYVNPYRGERSSAPARLNGKLPLDLLNAEDAPIDTKKGDQYDKSQKRPSARRSRRTPGGKQVEKTA